MVWPRFCASSSIAKVESPRMLIRSIGSICTAMFRLIIDPKYFPNVSRHAIALAAHIKSRGDMTRNPARCDQDGIEAHVADAVIGISRKPSRGSGDNAQTLAVGDRPGRIVQSIARLHLDEYQQASASRDDIDFSDRALPTPRQDAKALGDEKCRRSAFG